MPVAVSGRVCPRISHGPGDPQPVALLAQRACRRRAGRPAARRTASRSRRSGRPAPPARPRTAPSDSGSAHAVQPDVGGGAAGWPRSSAVSEIRTSAYRPGERLGQEREAADVDVGRAARARPAPAAGRPPSSSATLDRHPVGDDGEPSRTRRARPADAFTRPAGVSQHRLQRQRHGRARRERHHRLDDGGSAQRARRVRAAVVDRGRLDDDVAGRQRR